jgi:O-antigen/teichoic acid export membrane protein
VRPGSASRSQALLLLSFAGRLAMGLGLTIVLGRHLSPDGLGFVTLVGTLFVAAQTIMDPGTANLVVREVARDPARERPLLEGLWAWRTVLGAGLGLTVLVLAATEERPRSLALLGVAVVLLASGPGALRPVFLSRQAMEGPVSMTLLLPALVLAGGLGLAWSGAAAPAFAWLVVAREALTLLATWLLAVRLLGYAPRPGLRGRGLWPFARAAGVYGAAVLIHELSGPLDVMLVRGLCGEAALGAYAAAARPIGPLLQLPHLLMAPLLPLLAAGGDTRRTLGRAATVFAAIGLAGGGLGIALSRDLLDLLYRGRYLAGELDAVAAFAWLSLALALAFAAAPFATALLAAGRERELLLLAGLGLLARVAADLLLLPRHGFTAAAAVNAGTQALLLLGALGLTWRGRR